MTVGSSAIASSAANTPGIPSRAVSTILTEIPVAPDSDQATEWLINELVKAPYQAARPTLFDRASKAFTDWLGSFSLGDGQWASPIIGITVIVLLVIAAIVAALIVYGVPRLNRKSRHSEILFGDDEHRTAAQLRAAAERAAAEGNFASGVADMFRAIARGMSERTLVATTPGTTASGFAVQARRVVPEFAPAITVAADTFSLVRYAGKPATEQQYQQLRELEQSIRLTKVSLSEAAV